MPRGPGRQDRRRIVGGRSGGSHKEFCAKCRYQVAPDGPRARNCPECGHRWQEPVDTTFGRKHIRKPIAVAALLTVAICAIPTSKAYDQLIHLLPTDVLIAQVTCSEYALPGAWDELNTRSLSPAACDQLATRILERRYLGLADPHLAERWMAQYIRRGRADPAIVDRYLTESLTIRLDQGSGGNRRESCDVCFHWRQDDQLAPEPPLLAACITRWELGDHTRAIYRMGDAYWLIDGQRLQTSLLTPTGRRGVRPGKHRITITILLILDPPSSVIFLSPSGQPIRLPVSTWHKLITLEGIVTVVEEDSAPNNNTSP